MPRNLILINPASNSGRALENLAKAVGDAPAKIRTKWEKSTRIVLEKDQRIGSPEVLKAIEKHKRIFIVAGDGTVNSLVTEVLRNGWEDDKEIGVIPGGFGNAVAAMLGIDDTGHGLELLRRSTVSRKVDVFGTNLEAMPYVTFAAGVGFEGEIIHEREKKRAWSVFGYVYAAVLTILRHRKGRYVLRLDGRSKLTVRAAGVMFANGPFYGQALAAPQARIDDGFIDVRVFRENVDFLLNLQPRKNPIFDTRNLSFIDIHARTVAISGRLKVQVDGDPVDCGLTFELRALQKKVRYLWPGKALARERLAAFRRQRGEREADPSP